MSFVVYPATVIQTTAMIDIPPTRQMSDCVLVEILNDSSWGLNAILPGNNVEWIPPQSGKFVASNDFYGQDIKIFPMQVMNGAFSGLPQQLTIIGFNKGDQTPPAGTVIDLSKIVVVANTVNTTSGTSNAVVNTNNPTSTPVVTGQVSGDPSDGLLLDNNGTSSFGTVANPAQVTVNGATGGVAIQVNTGSIKCLGNVIANADFELIDNGSNVRPFAYIDSANNDTTIATNVNNGILHIKNSAQTQDIATFADSSLTATFNGPINVNVAGITVNGSVGSATLFQDMIGVHKHVFIELDNFTVGSSALKIALPTAFTKGALLNVGAIRSSGDTGGQLSLLLSNVAQTVEIVTTLSSSAGLATGATTIPEYAIVYINGPFDTVNFVADTSGPHTGIIVIEGR